MSDERPLSVELTYLVQVLGNMPIVHGDGVPVKHVREIIPEVDVLRTRATELEAENARLREMIGQVRYPDCPATRGIAWRLNDIRERRKRREAQRREMRSTGDQRL